MSQLTPIAPGKNLLSADIEIKGTVTFKSDLITHGKIQGEILSTGTLTVGPTGRIDGDIQAVAVAVHGEVNGNITVEQRCELKGNARLIGDLEAPRLVMEDGATFIGRSNVVPRGTSAGQGQKTALAE